MLIKIRFNTSFVTSISPCIDSDARRLEYGVVERYGENFALGCAVFRSVNDLWELRPV